MTNPLRGYSMPGVLAFARRHSTGVPVLALLLGLSAPSSAQAPQTPTAEKTVVPTRSPEMEALSGWIEAFFPWGAGDVKVDEITQVRIPGYRFVRATKTVPSDARLNDQCFAALDDDGRHAIVGDVFFDEERAKKPAPVKGDADLEALRERLKKYLRSPFRLVLDPTIDRRGWKGLKIRIDTGYGNADVPAYVRSDDGALMILGRVWDRHRSVPEQRREVIKLDSTPMQGPADAKVTIVEYSDMQCGFCKRRTNDWEPLTAKLAPILKIKRYFKSFPLTSEHPWAFRAASAGRCFFESDPQLFLRWKSQVYKRQDELNVAAVDTFALDFAVANGVSEESFKSCYLQPKSTGRVLADLGEGYSVRVRATPTYFIDGVLVSWYSDNLMEEYLRKTYLKGAGLPLPTTVPRTPPAGGH